MVPSERYSLEATLADLHQQQLKAMNDATYLGWTQESWQKYDERRYLILKIGQQLGVAQIALTNSTFAA